MQAENENEALLIIARLLNVAKEDPDTVAKESVHRIESDNFDGNRWSVLATAFYEALKNNEKAEEIFKALMERESDNSAYLNNYGVFMARQGKFDEALQYYVRAYAIDYKKKGHKSATKLPGWNNFLKLASHLQKTHQKTKELIEEILGE